MVSVLYTTHNRLYYTGVTLPRVIDECRKSENFGKLYIYDDDSTDGTIEYLQSLKLDIEHEIVYGKYGDTVSQLKDMMRKTKNEFFYHIGNDIILPEGIMDILHSTLRQTPNAISVMIEETANLPFINPGFEVHEREFTSSLGLHRSEYFKRDIPSGKRFYGFAVSQRWHMEKYNLIALGIKGMGNTNLDMSPWSRQVEYESKGWSRIGYCSSDLSIYED